MSDSNKIRAKYRFNIIDVLLLLIIVISIAAMLFLYFYNGKLNDGEKDVEKVKIVYAVKQTEVPAILRGKINTGDSVIDGETLNVIGSVMDLEYTDSVYELYDGDTESRIEEKYPGKIDIKVWISAEAVVDENGLYVVNGCAVNSGKVTDLRFPNFTGEAVIVSVSEVSEQ